MIRLTQKSCQLSLFNIHPRPISSRFRFVVDVSILTLVVLWVSLVLSIVMLILMTLDNIQRLHDLLSLSIILYFDLFDQFLRMRCWRKCSFSSGSLALWRIIWILFGRGSQWGSKFFSRSGSISGGFRSRRIQTSLFSNWTLVRVKSCWRQAHSGWALTRTNHCGSSGLRVILRINETMLVESCRRNLLDLNSRNSWWTSDSCSAIISSLVHGWNFFSHN